jgi:hypothetical protein
MLSASRKFATDVALTEKSHVRRLKGLIACKLHHGAGLTAGDPQSKLPRIGAPRAIHRLAEGGATARWRSGYAAACKAVYTGSSPVRASTADPE